MMKKFRVLSDLHCDYNCDFPLTVADPSVFTLLCGDTSGKPKNGHSWIRRNMRNGLIICGNHLPYNDTNKTILDQKKDLAKKYPISGAISFLDAELGLVKKEVDGVLFLGTCMYSDMCISDIRNPSGSYEQNCFNSQRRMNDYHYGIKSYDAKNLVADVEGKLHPAKVHMTPQDCAEWFKTSKSLLEAELAANEAKEQPLPVVLFTHFPLIKDILKNSYYVDADNFASYGSDQQAWLMSHPSIRCYCCGHAHAVAKQFRSYKIKADDGHDILVVNNARGYVNRGHDRNFHADFFVNTETWEAEILPDSPEEEKHMSMRAGQALANELALYAWC